MTTQSSQGSHPTRTPSSSEQKLIDDILKLYQLQPSEQAYSHYSEDAVFHDPVTIAKGLDSIKSQFNGMPKLFAESVTEKCDMLASSTPNRIELNLTQRYVFKSPIPFKEKGTVKPVNSKVTFHLNGAGLIERHDEEWDHETNKSEDDGFFGKVQAFRKKTDAKLVEKTVPSDPSKPGPEQDSDLDCFPKMSKIVPSQQSLGQTTVEFDIGKYPTMSTIIWLKTFLIKRLPLELVELVLDHAEFWPHTTTVKPKLGLVRTPVKWRCTSSDILSSSWPSPESKAMQEVLGFTLYSPPLASESSLTRAGTLKKGLRRIVLKDQEFSLPPRGQHPARMIVFEAVSQRYDIQTGKFCDVGIIREDDQLLEQDMSEAGSQRRNSSVFSNFRSNTRPSKSAKPDKTHQLVAQRDCWFLPGAKAEGKYVIKWRHDEDLEDRVERHKDEEVVPTTADFIGKLKVGDTIGLWAPVVRGNCVYRIDEVRMHVFWAV